MFLFGAILFKTNLFRRHKVNKSKTNNNNVSLFIDQTDCDSGSSTPCSSTGSSGHKGSLRGTKLARRARSFKDDFLEKISQIRTPNNTMTRYVLLFLVK